MIRQATRYDIPQLLEIVEAYGYEYPMRAFSDKKNHNAEHVGGMLFEIIVGRGFIFVDDNFRGAIIAVRQRNVWCPDVIELHELLWWIKPEFRNGMLGGRLWKAFDDKALELLDNKQIHAVIASVSASGPLIDYRKRGYTPMGASFVKE